MEQLQPGQAISLIKENPAGSLFGNSLLAEIP